MPNRITDRYYWRAETEWVGVLWDERKPGEFAAMELRNDKAGNAVSRPLGFARRQRGQTVASCAHCERVFELESRHLNCDGEGRALCEYEPRSDCHPSGPWCCSDECRHEFYIEAMV